MSSRLKHRYRRSFTPAPALRRPRTATLTEDDLFPVFQPIVNAQTAELFGYEALARCRVEEFSNPAWLFDYASKHGDAGRLGRLVRRAAVRQSAGKVLFVNVHPSELQMDGVLSPDEAIFDHDSPVFLELTESAALSEDGSALELLAELRKRGNVQLAVDDFGAGHSNLRRLLELEPSIVKLDRALVSGLDHNDRQRSVFHRLVSLCTDLGAHVVAEGVETLGELSAVADAGAHYIQGYLLAKPSAPHPVARWPESMPPLSAPVQSNLRRCAAEDGSEPAKGPLAGNGSAPAA